MISRGRSSDRRVGLAINYLPTHARQAVSKRDSAMPVRGVDEFGHFDHKPEPKTDFRHNALAFQAALTRERSTALCEGAAGRPA